MPDKAASDKKADKDEKVLQEFTVNYGKLAAKGKLDPLIGRKNEVNRMMQVLCRRRKNNPLLVGEPGVGKTAIAEGLALLIHADTEARDAGSKALVPDLLQDVDIFLLDMEKVSFPLRSFSSSSSPHREMPTVIWGNLSLGTLIRPFVAQNVDNRL